MEENACAALGHRLRKNDKNPVVALREIAEKTVSPGDMRERLIHSIQKQVEVDEPEAVAAPGAARVATDIGA